MNDNKIDAVDNFLNFILSENAPLLPEDKSSLDMFDKAVDNAEKRLAHARLERAKAGVAASVNGAKTKNIDLERARHLFERAKAGDPTAQVTLAARFGDGSMDGDMDYILEDLAELEEENDTD